MDMPRYEAVEISYGDTLWRIAQERNYGEGDIRRAVHEISRLNGIKDGCIYPGQIIVVPLKAKKAA
jgi:LysM repeat protein